MAKYGKSLVDPASDILPQFLQLFVYYLTILDRVITALDCICNLLWPSDAT